MWNGTIWYGRRKRIKLWKKDIIADYKKPLDVLKETQQSQIDKINSDNETAKSKIIQEDKDKYSELLKDYELL